MLPEEGQPAQGLKAVGLSSQTDIVNTRLEPDFITSAVVLLAFNQGGMLE